MTSPAFSSDIVGITSMTPAESSRTFSFSPGPDATPCSNLGFIGSHSDEPSLLVPPVLSLWPHPPSPPPWGWGPCCVLLPHLSCTLSEHSLHCFVD